MCKKQTAVSHSNAESEIILLEAGLRMDGAPALQFGACVSETLPNKPAEGNLDRHKRERVIPSRSRPDNCVFFESFDNVLPNIPYISRN